MLNSPKRKNNEESTGQLRTRLLMALLAVGVVIGAAVLRGQQNPIFIHGPHFPLTPLLYALDEHYVSINLQTGVREKAWQPRFTAPSDSPADILVAQSLIDKMTGNTHEPFSPSPDGQWLAAWTYTVDGQGKLMLYDRYGQGRTHSLGVFGFTYWGALVRWSADSQNITFSTCVSKDDGTSEDDRRLCDSELWLVEIQTGKTKRLTDNTVRDSSPDLSPQGTYIVYSSDRDEPDREYSHLYIMDMITGTSRLLTPNLYAYNPVWSPDGEWIAFVVFHPEDFTNQIWLIRPDGTDAQAISERAGGYEDEDVEWLR